MRTTHKLFLSGLVVAAGTLLAGQAQARDDVSWSVTIGTPGVVVPAPVYGVVPAPVVGVPVYHDRHYNDRYYNDRRYNDRHYNDRYRDRHWRESRWQEPTRWDRDGDGIPNRRDPVYNPRWDRDGDGVPNWRDRRPNWEGRNDGRHDRRW